MITSPAHQIADRVREQQALILAITRDLTDEQFVWQANSHAPAIRFHLWHIARWADLVQAHLPGMSQQLADHLGLGRELWVREELADAWGLAGHDLGFLATGMSLSDEAAMALPLPGQAALLDYATRAFAAADRAVAAVDDALFSAAGRDLLDRQTSIGGAILNHLLHVGRHLGMIEALRGIQGLRGTATR